jgi:hypothetical protein
VSGQGAPRVGSAGWSAAAKAQEVREAARGGVVRRFLRALGVDPGAGHVEAEAGRWEAGARGEAMTDGLLVPLAAEGWGGFYDRALPRGRANFDHVMVAPSGDLVVLVDSKLWSKRRGAVRRVGGGLRHGQEDRQGSVRSLLFEARVLREELARARVLPQVRVVPVMAVHSAPVAGGRFMLEGITVVEAGGLVGLLRQVAGTPDRVAFDRLAAAADAVLPRYVEGGRG